MNPETTPERGKGDIESMQATQDASTRWQRTAVAAFYRAEARGFTPGGELDDWLAAERELDAETKGPAAMAEPIPEAKAAPAKRPAAKRAGRSGKSERGTGSNIGGMA